MNYVIRNAAYSLLGVSIALTLLLAYPEVNRSGAKARAIMPAANVRAKTTDTVEEKVTLHPANLNTRGRLWHWAENHSYCGPPAYLPKKLVYPEDIPGTIVAGFKNYYDKGAPVFGCPEGSNAAFRGAVWFDLSDIMKKAPPLHVAVQSATLNFKLSGGCPHELLYATADWMTGPPDNTLVTGDHVASLGSCLPGMDSCSIDVSVETVVNNWLKGAEHGGYANYGFVFKGMQDANLHYENSDSCYSRYGNFTLTVDYTYDKEPVIMAVLPKPTLVGKPGVSLPGGEGLALARTNYALAANGGVASASSELDSGRLALAANNGDTWGLHWGSDPATGSGWHDATKGVYPDWLRVDFKNGKEKLIDEIDVYSVQDNVTAPGEPKADTPFSQYGITEFDVQYWNGSEWRLIGSVTGPPYLVWRKFTVSPAVRTSAVRIWVRNALNDYSRIVELEAWGN